MRPSVVMLVFLAASPLAAQQSASAAPRPAADSTQSPRVLVRGRVVAVGTGEAVPGATIKGDNRIEARTDSTGAFRFCAPRGDAVQVDAFATGFAPGRAVVPAPGRDTTPVLISMERSLAGGVYIPCTRTGAARARSRWSSWTGF